MRRACVCVSQVPSVVNRAVNVFTFNVLFVIQSTRDIRDGPTSILQVIVKNCNLVDRLPHTLDIYSLLSVCNHYFGQTLVITYPAILVFKLWLKICSRQVGGVFVEIVSLLRQFQRYD